MFVSHLGFTANWLIGSSAVFASVLLGKITGDDVVAYVGILATVVTGLLGIWSKLRDAARAEARKDEESSKTSLTAKIAELEAHLAESETRCSDLTTLLKGAQADRDDYARAYSEFLSKFAQIVGTPDAAKDASHE